MATLAPASRKSNYRDLHLAFIRFRKIRKGLISHPLFDFLYCETVVCPHLSTAIPLSSGRPFPDVHISLYFACSGTLYRLIMRVLESRDDWPKRPVIPTRKMSGDNDKISLTCGKITVK